MLGAGGVGVCLFVMTASRDMTIVRCMKSCSRAAAAAPCAVKAQLDYITQPSAGLTQTKHFPL